MSEERCPLCGGSELNEIMDAGIDVRVCPNCDFCMECGTGAYFEPRDRLPTEAEERAHRERWGDGAGWMVRIVGTRGGLNPALRRWSEWEPSMLDVWREMVEEWRLYNPDDVIESYPIAPDGRPVGWPTVEEDEA